MPLGFSRVLFQMVTNFSPVFKEQFLQEQGVLVLKKLLKSTFESRDYEIYIYCLGMLPPLIFLNQV